ncbi:MAG TPA: hypothetical protein VKK31_24075 [Thermoanaerobaculia bacterium]|nr:hypothetical protein [Thermoanaerobaculia bacterium]
MKMTKVLPIALIAISLAAGCGGKQTPVAGVEVEPRLVRLPFSQVRTARLTWTPTVALEGDAPTVFVHLLDGQRKVVRTFDHPFPQRWREGVPVSYDLKLYQSALAPALPAGKYQVTLGLYNKEGRRWALDGLGEPKGRNEYDAAEIEVPPPAPGTRFAFSAAWLPVEPGSDRQVLARRWMAKRSAIRLVDQKEPGTLWMVIQIPPTNGPDAKLVLDPGASAPSVLVVGNCGGTETNLSGPGIHEVELSMEAPPANGFCRVLLSSNFLLEPTVPTARKRSVSLDNIAWMPRQGS